MMTSYLGAVFRTAAPLLLALVGAYVSDRVGIQNFALEGALNIGAFAGVVAAMYTDSTTIGIIAAVAAAMLLQLIYVCLSEFMHGDTVITGIGLSMLSAGFTKYMTVMLMGMSYIYLDPKFKIVSLPLNFLSGSEALSTIFAGHTLFVYLAPILLVLLWLFMFKTSVGLNVRASGLNRNALEAAGVKTRKYRIFGVLFAGAMCGLAGVHMSLGYLTMFSDNMIAGRGYIVYAAVIFGRGDPWASALACLVFAAAEALSYRSQQLGLSSYIVSMLPYVATVVALIIQGYRSKRLNRDKNYA